MGLSLRPLGKRIGDIVHGVERQVNPFDNGATYSNPRIGSPPARPIGQQVTQAIHRVAQTPVIGPLIKADQGIVHAGIDVGHYIARTPETISRSVADPIYNKIIAPTFDLPKQNFSGNAPKDSLRAKLYGNDPAETYQKRAEGNKAVLKGSRFRGAADVLTPIATALTVAGDVTGTGGLRKKGAEEAANLAKATLKSPNIDSKLEETVLGNKNSPNFKNRPVAKLAERLSPNKQARKVTQAVEEHIVNPAIRSSLESGSTLLRTPGRTAVGISRQAGRTPEEIQRLSEYQGQKEYGDILAKSVAKTGEVAVSGGVRKEAVHSLLDPELSRAKGVNIVDHTPEEIGAAQHLRKINDLLHEGNYRLGMIDDATYKANKGKYLARNADDFFKNDASRNVSRDNKLELGIYKPRKELSDIPKDVIKAMDDDPFYLTALRTQQYERNKAYVDYSNWLSKNGSLSRGPRKGYVQVPDSPAYGSLKGQYVLKEQLEDLQGFIYETDAAQHATALLNWYDRNPLRKARKSVLTIYNPGVRLGNRTFNYLVSSLNGINPVTFTRNYYRGRRMIKSNSPEYIEATKAGIFGSSIIDKELYRSTTLRPSQNIAKRVHNKAAETYSKVDDEAKMAAYTTFRERGLSPAEAATRTRRMLQNYDMVGHLFDLGAKTPIAGNAFVRFSSELIRIAHNTAVDNPLRAAGAAVAASSLITLASHKSGESEQDRKTREGRLGAPRVPFTNQSLEVQTPWGAINTGRLLGLTTYNDLTGGIGEDTKRLTPLQNPIKRDEDGSIHANISALTADPLIGPLVGLAMNRDFRGKPIADPDVAKYPSQPLSKDQQLKNQLNYLKMSYVPYANEADSLKAAKEGKPNYYGKERSVAQATLRVGGVKVEKFGHKQAEDERGKNDYFDAEHKRAQNFLKQNPSLAAAYSKFKGTEKVRTGTDKGKRYDDLVTPEKWRIISADQSGKLYDFLKSEAQTSHKKDGKPIDPIFQLPTSQQAKQILDLRSKPTGDDIETEEILSATQPWYSKFKQAEKNYYSANDKFYSGKNLPDTQGPRAKAYAALVYPVQSDLIKQYYQYKNGDTQSGKNFYKANADALSADFSKYRGDKLKYINAKRKIEGYPPIDASVFNNVTFGYEDDERKVFNELRYSKGYGDYGSGNYGNKDTSYGTNNPYKYAVSINAGHSSISKPTVSLKKTGGAAKAKMRKSAAKPRVTIRKSRV